MGKFSLSSVAQNHRLLKRIFFVIYTMIIILVSLLPTDPQVQVLVWDKLGHFLAYLGMSVLALLTFRTNNGRIAALLFVMGLGLVLEWLQSFVPGRVTSWDDAIANGLGVLVGTAVYFLLQNQLTQIYDWFWKQLGRIFAQ